MLYAHMTYISAYIMNPGGLSFQNPQVLENTADNCIYEDPDAQILLKYLCFLNQ